MSRSAQDALQSALAAKSAELLGMQQQLAWLESTKGIKVIDAISERASVVLQVLESALEAKSAELLAMQGRLARAESEKEAAIQEATKTHRRYVDGIAANRSALAEAESLHRWVASV